MLAKFTKFREERFGGVLFEKRSEKVYSLNPTAAAIVRKIVPGVDEPPLVERLKLRFNDQGGALESEVKAYLASLRELPKDAPAASTGASDLRAPLYVAWQVTNECNLACLHCIEESGPGKPFRDELADTKVFEVLRQLMEGEVP